MSRGPAVLALVGATALWAGNYVVGERAVQTVDPIDLTAMRWVLAAVPLLVLAQVLERPDWRTALGRWPLLLLLGLIGMAGYNLALYEALRHTTAVSASLINAVNPALITLAAALFLREGVGWRGIVGMLLGFCGIVLVLTKGSVETLASLDFNVGDLLMLVAIAAWTFYTILGGRAGVPPITSTAIQATGVAVVMVPVAAVSGFAVPSTAEATWSVLFIGLVVSTGAYVLWNLAARSLQKSISGVFLNLITVFTVLASVALGTPIGAAELVGGLVVLAGVVLTTLDRARRPVAPVTVRT
jgi:drug/metabolite transporter (DMT)-like permease